MYRIFIAPCRTTVNHFCFNIFIKYYVYSAAEPCLCLRVDMKIYEEVGEEWDSSSNSFSWITESKIPLRLPGLIMNHVRILYLKQVIHYGVLIDYQIKLNYFLRLKKRLILFEELLILLKIYSKRKK